MDSTKKMVSFRLDTSLLALLERVSRSGRGYFSDRGKTWLIETAIRETYGSLDLDADIAASDNGDQGAE